ncbi:MAG: MlaD family protein [Kiloniellales bacterium]|nr:MlaD family protein [Kiloniellales bacterium]
METRANYLLVGSFVLALALGLIGFVIWLAKVQFDTQFSRYDIYFESSITGLQVGGQVKYRGITVGEVTSITIDPSDVTRVLVTIEVEADTPVREDTVATLNLLSLTSGALFIQLTGGSHVSPPLIAKPGQRLPVIRSEPLAFDKLIGSIDDILIQVADILNAENRQAISQTLQNVATITAALAERREEIDQLIADASAMTASLRGAAESVETLTKRLDRTVGGVLEQAEAVLGAFEEVARNMDGVIEENAANIEDTIDDLRDMADGLRKLSEEAKALVAENRGPIRDFTETGLYELSTLLTEARELVVSFKRVATEVERDPARFLFGDQQQGYEAGLDTAQ